MKTRLVLSLALLLSLSAAAKQPSQPVPAEVFPLSEAQALFASQYNPAGPFKVEPRWQEAVWSVQGKGRKAVAVCQVPLTSEETVYVERRSDQQQIMRAQQTLFLTKSLRGNRLSAMVRYEAVDDAEPKDKGFSGIVFYTPLNSKALSSAERYLKGKRVDAVEYDSPRPNFPGSNLYYIGTQEPTKPNGVPAEILSDTRFVQFYEPAGGPGLARVKKQKQRTYKTPDFMADYRVFSHKEALRSVLMSREWEDVALGQIYSFSSDSVFVRFNYVGMLNNPAYQCKMPYYLSDSVENSFDVSKVGLVEQGRYIYTPLGMSRAYSYDIVSFSLAEIVVKTKRLDETIFQRTWVPYDPVQSPLRCLAMEAKRLYYN